MRLHGPSIRIAILGSVALLLFVLPALVRFAANWLWMGEVGFRTVLVREVATRLALFVGVGLAAYAFLRLNLGLTRRPHGRMPALLDDIAAVHASRTGVPGRFLGAASLVASMMLALVAASGWLAVLKLFNGVPFGVGDPVFGRDVAFYTFTLPVLAGVLALLVALTVLALMFVGASYLANGGIALTGDIAWSGGGTAAVAPPRLRVTRAAGNHLAALGALLLALTALRIWLVGLPELVFSTTGPLVGASYTDVHARLPGMHVAAVAALVAAGVIVLGIVRGRTGKYAAGAIAGYAVVSLLARGVYPAAVQKLVVAPTELTREQPYLARHIAATRRAWGLDSVITRDLRGEATLTLADIKANGATIENVRLWDRDPLLQTFGQIQEIRTYYDFVSVDDDRYWIDGRYRQVLLSPRELNSASLPTRSFINEHLTFTHGMGLTLAPVNQVTGEGLPVLLVKDLPPASTGSLRTTRPQIYYGELTNNYAIVGTRQREFDHPSGEANIFANYRGTGGVPVSSLGRRLVLAWRFQSLKILLSGDITNDSRILYHRNIVERAQKALPFLELDGDPYLVINDAGELLWLMDAYTSSARYPYAQRLADGTSYMRNSVKVVIDAYHGSVRAFVADSTDPVVRTYARVFPGILQPIDSMPGDVRSHIRVPEDLFRAQVALYTIYHMVEPEEFYHREDQWQIPVVGEREHQNAFMRRIVMRLPEEERAEFIFMSPFTPRGKDNLASWMVARNDGEHYGKLTVYRFPKQSLVFGPQQIVNRMNQDTEIARQVSLWDQRGSEVIRGALMVIPIEESLIYVQPLYLRAEGGKIPELKRVILAHQNRVVMEETLEAGLSRLFGGVPSRPVVLTAAPETADETEPAPALADGTTAELLGRAREHYDRAIAAQRAGDWATYGAEIARLGEALRGLGGAPPTVPRRQ
ncbi:MAG TPA: UPF0182 family protein [Gemmatimonadaceae bacterium]|nr:UPF0182 family protein [Gemmatimonadaceae bacterium]